MDIGQRLREARKAEGLTQEALARKASVSLNGVRQIETGIRLDPHLSTLTKIATALEMPVAQLLTDNEVPDPDPSLMSVEELARFSHRMVEAAQVAVKKTGAKGEGSLALAEKLDRLSDTLPGFLKLSLAMTLEEEEGLAPKWRELLEVSQYELKAVADKAYQQAVEESIAKDDATLTNIHERREKLGAEMYQFSKQRAG